MHKNLYNDAINVMHSPTRELRHANQQSKTVYIEH